MNKLYFLSVTVWLSLVATVTPVGRCPVEWVHFTGIDSCYFFSRREEHWKSARAYCTAVGANLVKADLKDEVRHIMIYLETFQPYWIGLYRDAERWMWVDGIQVNATELYVGRWAKFDPRNGSENEWCGVIGYLGFGNCDCSNKLRFLCQKPSTETNKPLFGRRINLPSTSSKADRKTIPLSQNIKWISDNNNLKGLHEISKPGNHFNENTSILPHTTHTSTSLSTSSASLLETLTNPYSRVDSADDAISTSVLNKKHISNLRNTQKAPGFYTSTVSPGSDDSADQWRGNPATPPIKQTSSRSSVRKDPATAQRECYKGSVVVVWAAPAILVTLFVLVTVVMWSLLRHQICTTQHKRDDFEQMTISNDVTAFLDTV